MNANDNHGLVLSTKSKKPKTMAQCLLCSAEKVMHGIDPIKAMFPSEPSPNSSPEMATTPNIKNTSNQPVIEMIDKATNDAISTPIVICPDPTAKLSPTLSVEQVTQIISESLKDTKVKMSHVPSTSK